MVKSFRYVCLLPLVLLGSCAGNHSNQSASTNNLTHSRLHTIMTTRIEVALDQIDNLLTDQNRTETELDYERRYKAIRIADSAAELQRTVDIILALQPTLELTANEAPVFTRAATRLKEQSAELEDLARRNQIDALKPAMARVKNTCMTCHSLFRGY